MSKRIKITDAADVRPGDMVTMRDGEHTWRGKAWEHPQYGLYVGKGDKVRYTDGTPGAFFVHATRKAPKPTPLPTTPGTVLLATVRGVPGVQVMRTAARPAPHWASTQLVRCAYWHADADITDWETKFDPKETR